MSDITQTLADIESWLTEAEGALARGAIAELSGLDDRVEALCTMALEIKGSERQAHLPRLEALMTRLAAHGEALQEQRALVMEEIGSVAQQRKAHVAYQVADSSDKKA